MLVLAKFLGRLQRQVEGPPKTERFLSLRRIVRTALDRQAGKKDRPDAAVGFRCGDCRAKLFGTDILMSPEYVAMLLKAAGEPVDDHYTGEERK